jgi:cyclophilin family peptidyl-prolyl cis-trans isomerase
MYIMISKSWFCGLLTAFVLVCGCGEGAKKANFERNTMTSETKTVKLETSMGNIVIELNEQAAPLTVKNFIGYVEEGFYDGTIFHRVIPDFMIQGGGFTAEMERKQARAPIKNEFKLSNVRGTIAMAKSGGDPDSATCQFFISLTDNSRNLDNQNGGFTVFGKVIEGMDVVDAIASVVTTMRMGYNDVPVKPIVIQSAGIVSE